MKVPKKKTATLLAHYAEDRAGHHGAVVPPLYQNSLFVFDEWDAIDAAFDDRFENPIYTRGTNPTVRMVEQKLAALAGGEAARLFASGMAAVTAAVMHFVDAGDHVIAVKNVYGPANNLLNRYFCDWAAIPALVNVYWSGKPLANGTKTSLLPWCIAKPLLGCARQ